VRVPAAKVRRILKLVNEAHEIADSNERLQLLCSGICGVVGADNSVMFVFDSARPSVPQAGFIYGYCKERAPEVLAEYVTQGDQFDLMAKKLRLAYDGEPAFARRRQDLIDDRAWYNSDYVNEFRRRWDFDHSIYSMSMHKHGGIHHAMSVNRPFGSTPFDAEDRTLIELFHLAAARVAGESLRQRRTTANQACRNSLAPRAREVLEFLLRGASNKDIAEQLRLSPNTVHTYCKQIFKAFFVKSRSELIADWFADR
jgi:DNA-binding CsgD family transcriptional regulator